MYWDSARQCEKRYSTLHLIRIAPNGDVTVDAAQDTRTDYDAFVKCYRAGIRTQVEQRRLSGKSVPDGVNVEPEVELD